MIKTRQSKGKILTHAELDNNFTELQAGMDANATAIASIPTNVVLQDGSVDMDAGYVPTTALSIATRGYTDNSVASVVAELNAPSTVDGDFRVRIANPSPADYDMFGEFMDVHGDLLVVGSPYDTNEGTEKGALYLYNIDGTLLRTITAPDAPLNPTLSAFGADVVMNSTVIVAGDRYATRNGQTTAGAIWIFDHNGDLITDAYPIDSTSTNSFGGTIDMNESIIAVADSGVNKVYVYDLTGTELFRIDAEVGSTTFGYEVAVNDTHIFVGSYGDNAVYMYDIAGTYIKTITASDSVAGDRFGQTIVADNTKLVISATDASTTGVAYIYDADGTNEVKLTPPTADVANTVSYGQGLAIEGDRILVGAPWSDDIEIEAGTAYLYDTAGTLIKKMVSNQQYFLSDYGWRVVVTPLYLVISSYGDPGTYSGSVHVYDRGVLNEVNGATTLGGYTADDFIKSDIVQAGAGSVAINNIVKIAQIDYDALVAAGAVDINTHYIIG